MRVSSEKIGKKVYRWSGDHDRPITKWSFYDWEAIIDRVIGHSQGDHHCDLPITQSLWSPNHLNHSITVIALSPRSLWSPDHSITMIGRS